MCNNYGLFGGYDNGNDSIWIIILIIVIIFLLIGNNGNNGCCEHQCDNSCNRCY